MKKYFIIGALYATIVRLNYAFKPFKGDETVNSVYEFEDQMPLWQKVACSVMDVLLWPAIIVLNIMLAVTNFIICRLDVNEDDEFEA